MCQNATCTDGVKNGTESDVDCGGASCVKCGTAKLCTDGTDCQSGTCTAGQCAASTCGSGLVFCDDFEDGNDAGWTKSGGTWTIATDGSFVFQGGGSSQEATAGDAAWTDQTVEARVRVVSFGGTSDSYRAGIIGRFAGASTFYVFAIGGNGNLTLRKSTSTPSGASGTCGAIAAGIDPTTAFFTLKMELSGPTNNVHIRTFLNGVLKHDCTTTSTTSGAGKVGFLTYGTGTVASFDDIKVSTP
jgi:pectate lyase